MASYSFTFDTSLSSFDSRLLAVLLNNVINTPAIEPKIAKTKSLYYDALAQSQIGWEMGKDNIESFIKNSKFAFRGIFVSKC